MKRLKIELKPYLAEDYSFQYAEVTMVLEEPHLEAGDMLASMWVMVAGVPGSLLEELTATDDTGKFVLTESIEGDPLGFDKRVWRVSRASSGDVTLSYRFYARDVSGVDRAYPLFDVIAEKNGALICGVTTLAAVSDQTYQIQFVWNTSAMPVGAETASIRGRGNFEFTGTPIDYCFSLYAVGKLQSATDSSGKYSVYWLDDQLPDQEQVERQLPDVLAAICNFFGDEDIRYSVFFRKEPYDISRSGTAFPGGFAYGYSNAMPLQMDECLNTIAHETVHNWPHLDADPGDREWFAEGTAEYYSMVIPYRAGLISLEQMAKWLTDKTINYYNNEFQTLSNREAFDLYWKDRAAQRVPYGRGLVYLIDTDQRIRERSGGKRSIDNLILYTVEKQRAGEKVTVADWEELLVKELGQEAVEMFRQVMGGKMIDPSQDWFNGAFTFTKGHFEDEKRGSFSDALIWQAKDGNNEIRF